MKRHLMFAPLLVAAACKGLSGSPPEFPFPVSLPRSVTTTGVVAHAKMARHEFVTPSGKESVEGESWSGNVRVDGAASHDASYQSALERSLINTTGWEAVYHDATRVPPISTLRRTLGGEIVWISLEGWADDLTVTVVHRK
jgi:hypothetical protein